jgi:hypothetical protein
MPSGFLISSAEDMAHFVIAQLNGGRFGATSILSPDGIAAMHAPGVAIGAGEKTYGLGWMTGSVGGVPIVYHTGDHPDAHTMMFIEPSTRRGAVLLMNANNIPALLTAYEEIQNGVARLLAEQEPTPAGLRLGVLYLLVDVVLGGFFVLVLRPLLRLRHWEQRLRQGYPLQRGRLLRTGLRLGWEFGLPLVLLLGVRLLIGVAFGTQSWGEILLLFPDFGAWLWAMSLLLLLTGAIRFMLLLRVLRADGTQGMLTDESLAYRI